MNAEINTLKAPPAGHVRADVNLAALAAAITEVAVSAVLDRFKPQLQAIVLTGSMARGEGTFVPCPGGWEALGDCEMVLMFKSDERLPASTRITDVERSVERQLERRCIACPVGMSAVHPSYFLNLTPHIYGYELRTCGRMLWGDPGVLALISAFTPRDIPLADAWRLICNRMIEQLRIADQDDQPEPSPEYPADYRTVKLCLDLATSLLLFCGEYAPTYGGRCERLQQLAERFPAADGLPFPLRPFATLVEKLTRWKLNPVFENLASEPSLRSTVWTYARRLWRWELLRLTGDKGSPSDARLMRNWMRRQPLHQRLRGWASLVRKRGWLRSWRDWPHWLRLGAQGSPRYWIYGAGSELFFQLPVLMGEHGDTCPDRFLQTWREWLPVRLERGDETKTLWQHFASEVTWNYRQFLLETYS